MHEYEYYQKVCLTLSFERYRTPDVDCLFLHMLCSTFLEIVFCTLRHTAKLMYDVQKYHV